MEFMGQHNDAVFHFTITPKSQDVLGFRKSCTMVGGKKIFKIMTFLNG